MPKDACRYLFICFDFFLFRYGVYELEYKTDDGRNESKIVFVLYAPDVVDSKFKFLYATTKEVMRKCCTPNNKELQINDWADLDEEKFIKHFKIWDSLNLIPKFPIIN